jgi:hypothetical protein
MDLNLDYVEVREKYVLGQHAYDEAPIKDNRVAFECHMKELIGFHHGAVVSALRDIEYVSCSI